MSIGLLESVRLSCEEESSRARHVTINTQNLRSYAARLPLERAKPQKLDPRYHYLGDPVDTIAYILTLDSINFGSGYSPHLRKRVGDSLYFTVALGLKERFEAEGPFSAYELTRLAAEDCANLVGQSLDDEPVRELMGLYASAMNELGHYVLDYFQGRFTNLVEAAGSSAERLVQILAAMPYYQDVASHDGLQVPFYKRAQITAADLSLALHNQRLGFFYDLDKLTIFADNAVPHILRVDGILRYEESLAARIDSGELIPSGSPEEVEIRAVALHAAELLVNEIRDLGHQVTSMGLDNLLWNLARQPHYRASQRHRTRTVYY